MTMIKVSKVNYIQIKNQLLVKGNKIKTIFSGHLEGYKKYAKVSKRLPQQEQLLNAKLQFIVDLNYFN